MNISSPTVAGDMVLMSYSQAGFNGMLQICHNYSRRWRYEYNPDKYGIIVFNESKYKSDIPMRWFLGDKQILETESYVHFGINTDSLLSSKSNMYNAGVKLRGTLLSISNCGLNADELNPTTLYSIYRSIVIPKGIISVPQGYIIFGPEMRAIQICTLLALFGLALSQTGDDTKNLLTKLFTTNAYNKNVRPLVNQSHIVTIYLDFVLNSVIEFDEQKESLKTAGYLEAYWFDEYLTWNASDYNNVTNLFIPQDDVWKPDLSLSNTFSRFKGMGSTYLNVVVDNDGFVQWFPFQIFESTCAVNIKYFPFDTQMCDLKFTAWSYTKLDVDINKGSKGVRLEDYVKNAAWDLVDTSSSEVNTGEVAVIFHLNLRRKPLFFLFNIIGPVILLTVLNIFTFVLPVESGEKAGYSVTVFLAMAVFLTIISDQLPNNSDTVSLIAVYLMLMTLLSTFIVCACLIQIRLSIRKELEQPVTGCYAAFVRLADCLRCRCCKQKPNKVKPMKQTKKREKDIDDSEEEYGPESITWMNVIHAMDFLLFWLSTFYTLFCTSLIAVLLVSNA
ncbi:neuronal acetylcholine receptor subunit beta-4-like [Mercenaria mercenaria]|uniref:neuronal acetylcholine receptor subunit beta-4-like n=1 Tax=Mercenaria mercenaria TaxID=6596 RepID=UPI00234ECCD9|nr:neuronal acetylcholine receptor subunit beta-4-like [Mercenaria mercenaria]